jgi:hypothetical protein
LNGLSERLFREFHPDFTSKAERPTPHPALQQPRGRASDYRGLLQAPVREFAFKRADAQAIA